MVRAACRVPLRLHAATSKDDARAVPNHLHLAQSELRRPEDDAGGVANHLHRKSIKGSVSTSSSS